MLKTILTWKDKQFKDSLTSEEKNNLKESPIVEISDIEASMIAGSGGVDDPTPTTDGNYIN